MQNMPIYEALAQSFAAEGVDTHFTLMGDGNMHWATAMKNLDGMSTFAVRHEHCACAMAMGYHLATGKVGVASVTCGPGFTQVMTALTGASRARIPMVIFAGEAPMHAKWYNQALDQRRQAVRTTSPRTRHSACTNTSARPSTSRVTSASPWCSACRMTCRSSRCRTLVSIRRR
jgi:thiamine pyrophosphate-dependent acetolactate synthase large subunit-like protein